MPKIILDLCGGTGAWSKPYREAGYDVRLMAVAELITEKETEAVVRQDVLRQTHKQQREWR